MKKIVQFVTLFMSMSCMLSAHAVSTTFSVASTIPGEETVRFTVDLGGVNTNESEFNAILVGDEFSFTIMLDVGSTSYPAGFGADYFDLYNPVEPNVYNDLIALTFSWNSSVQNSERAQCYVTVDDPAYNTLVGAILHPNKGMIIAGEATYSTFYTEVTQPCKNILVYYRNVEDDDLQVTSLIPNPRFSIMEDLLPGAIRVGIDLQPGLPASFYAIKSPATATMPERVTLYIWGQTYDGAFAVAYCSVDSDAQDFEVFDSMTQGPPSGFHYDIMMRDNKCLSITTALYSAYYN